jgi:hypothetical protein
MSVYARIQGGSVAELFTPPVGVPVSACFNGALTWVDVTSVSPAPQPGWTYTAGVFAAPVVSASDTRGAAQAALDKSDITVIRCIEHAVAVPAAWTTYRAALRAIVAGGPTSAALPTAPTYPAGT